MPNEFFIDEYTSAVTQLLREVVNDPSTYRGAEVMPSVTQPTLKVRNEIVEATGGMTQEHLVDTDPKYVQRFGTRVQQFEPGYYKETILLGESDILYLRELGQNDPSRRGINQYLDLVIDQLNRRIEARIEYLRWQAIFTGSFAYMGRTVSFNVPSANQVTPTVPWSTDGTSANDSADPVIDLRYWVAGGYGTFRKYKIQSIWMNSNTARWILDNSKVREWVTSFGANPALMAWDVNTVLKFLIPGLPPIEVYDGWWQEQTVTDSKIEVGDAIYFIPDGYLYFKTTPMGDKIGTFQQTLQLGGGSVSAPSNGKFLIVEECIAPGTRGGPKNPFIEVTGGVYGGPNLSRGFDLLTAYVGPDA